MVQKLVGQKVDLFQMGNGIYAQQIDSQGPLGGAVTSYLEEPLCSIDVKPLQHIKVKALKVSSQPHAYTEEDQLELKVRQAV